MFLNGANEDPIKQKSLLIKLWYHNKFIGRHPMKVEIQATL
jgi:hypothetical protein